MLTLANQWQSFILHRLDIKIKPPNRGFFICAKSCIFRQMKTQESNLQIQCVKWFRLQYPNVIIASIPNGGKRNAITASILKQEGVLAGMPDLIVCCAKNGYSGLFIEMKYGKNRLTDEQKEFGDYVNKQGYCTAVAYSAEEAIEIIDDYLSL